MNQLLRKISLSSLMFVTVLTLSFGSLVPKVSGLTTGDLVKGPNTDAVYYINGTMKHVFPDAKTYFTWYSNFDGVKVVTIAELDQFTTGAPVSYRPGTQLVTHPNTARVYAVEPGGKIRWIQDEATALALYGPMWGKWVRDVHELTFGNYLIGADMTAGMHSEGTLLKKTGDTTIYLVEGGKIRPFASSTAFDANNLNYDFVVEVASLTSYSTGSSVTGAESIATISGVGTGTVVTGGSVSVALSPNTAPGNTVLMGSAARMPITTVRLTTGDTAVTVDSIVIERGGIAQDGGFADFDLLRGDTMLPLNDSSKSLNAAHQATFNDDFTIPANSTWDVIVAANMLSGLLSSYAGEYPNISVVSIALKSGSTLTGTLPIMGNTMLVNGTLQVGVATVTAGANNPSAATKEVGTKDYIVSSIRITNNSTASNQDFIVKSITFKNNGSTAGGDVANLRLINTNTGATVATVATPDATDKVSFPGLSIEIKRGNNVNLDLRLDIKGGSARTISYDTDKQGDIVIYDTLRSANVLATYPNTGSPFYNAADTTVGNGTLEISSLSIAEQNIAENTTAVLLGRFNFRAEGEPITVKTLGLRFATSTSGTAASSTYLKNVRLKDLAGNTVAGPKDPTANYGAEDTLVATTTDNFTVPVGTSEYRVYGDLSSDWSTDQTLQVGIQPNIVTTEGDVSGNTITPTPTSLISSTNLTIKTAGLTVSLDSTPTAQTVVAGASDYEFGRIILDASNSGSDVRVTQVGVVVTSTDTAANVFQNIRLYDGSTQIPYDSRTQSCSAATCSTSGDSVSATTTFTITAGNLTVPKKTSKTIRVVGDVSTADTSGFMQIELQGGNITGIDSDAQSSVQTYTVGDGGNMTLASGGTLNISVPSDPVAALVVGGTTATVGKLTLQAKNEGMSLSQFGFTLSDPASGLDRAEADQIDTLSLWEEGGSSALGTITISTSTATITPTSAIALAINTTKTYLVKATFSVPNFGGSSPAISGAGVRASLSFVDADGTSAGSTAVTLNGLDTNFNDATVFRSLPTVTRLSVTQDQISGNSVAVDLYKMSITADAAGPVGLAKFTFGVNTTTVTLDTAAGFRLWYGDSSGSQTSLLSNTNDFQVTDTLVASTNFTLVEARFDIGDDNSVANATADYGEPLIMSAGSVKYFTLQGTVSAGHNGTANDETVATTMSGDASFIPASWALNTMADIDGAVGDDFIWSDLNFDQNSTSTATETLGWFNGYRVPGLDNNSSTASVQTD